VEVLSRPAEEALLHLRLHFVPSSVESKNSVPHNLSPSKIRLMGPFGDLSIRTLTVDAAHGFAEVTAEPPALDLAVMPGAEFILKLVHIANVDPFFDQALVRLLPPEFTDQAKQRRASTTPLPSIDYLAKDYASFRRAILESMALAAPGWKERNVADLGMAIVEILAYVGDSLSYYQDSVTTERHLHTARLRASVKRHLRLLGYELHEGCNARTWVHVSVDSETRIKEGTVFFASTSNFAGTRIDPPAFAEVRDPQLQVYQAMHAKELFLEQNQMEIYTWGAASFALQKGAVRATLKEHLSSLEKGQVLIFEGSDEVGALRAHAVRLSQEPRLGFDPLYKEAVTEIEWYVEDSLPETFTVSRARHPESPTTFVLGNIVLVDHGRQVIEEELPPIPSEGPYRPDLREKNLTFACAYDDRLLGKGAASALIQDPTAARAEVFVDVLSEDGETDRWEVSRDLLIEGSNPCFAVEVENNGKAFLRFGDGVFGIRPREKQTAFATYRTGNGPAGEVAANALNRIVTWDSRVLGVRNPLSAKGGWRTETLEHARLHAPTSVWAPHRCITDDDYRLVAEEIPGVNRAFVSRSTVGSRTFVTIAIQRQGQFTTPNQLLDEVASRIEPLRMLGVGVAVVEPRFVPISVAMTMELTPGAHEVSTRQAVFAAFSANEQGFFHPDRLSFGDPLHASALVEWALQVEGVRSAWVEGMQILGRPEDVSGTLCPRPGEILALNHNSRRPLGSLSIAFKER